MVGPSMQDIADAISTSRITVWKALNNRPGVSDSMRKNILNKAQEMGYKKIPLSSETDNATLELTSDCAPKTVAAVISRPDSSIFWMQIIHQVAKELSKKNINLLYTYLPTYYKNTYAMPTMLDREYIDGMIILNVYSHEFLQRLSEVKLPKVFLDTVPSISFDKLNGDLVMIQGKSILRDITLSVIEHGVEDLTFIGDVEYAQTNTERFEGFKEALQIKGLPFHENRNLTKKLGLETHYEEISDFLSSLKPFPKAILCASDYIAHFVKLYCTENENEDTKNVIITGFDNNDEYVNVAEKITTVNVDTHSLGARLADKIMFRIEHPHSAFELSYVKSDIIYYEPLI